MRPIEETTTAPQPQLPFKVNSQRVQYTNDSIISHYLYENTVVKQQPNGQFTVEPTQEVVQIKTTTKVPRTGVMMVGWGGNNGTTVTAAILANRHKISYRTKEGIIGPSYTGSVTQASTVSLGRDADGQEIFVPLGQLVPMVDPTNLELDGWDISGRNLADAMEAARVLEYDLQRQVAPYMEKMKPRKTFYQPNFIAANQEARADNLMSQTHKKQVVEQLRADIRDFKSSKKLDTVIVLWTANTERYCEVDDRLHGDADKLLAAIERNESEISPSTLFAVASIMEKACYINGSPQNTFVPGVIDLAEREGSFLAGDDLKSGQTKLKSVLVDFLISAGLKPTSIVSYNHLGNNDGMNLSSHEQFRSKEISKSNVVDDMVESNSILYKPGEKPDHTVVIKYVPYVGDSKRAMDEYISELMFGGRNTIAIHNTCEDSLLAAPIIIDLIILGEMSQRIQFKQQSDKDWEPFHPVLTLLSYLSKAPIVPPGTPVVNALFKQRQCIENVFRACVGLPPVNNMMLEYKIRSSAVKYADNPVKTPMTAGHNLPATITTKKVEGAGDYSNGAAIHANGTANGHSNGKAH